MNRNNIFFSIIALVLAGVSFTLSAQVPGKPNPPRLVNDFAKIFTPQQVALLEDSLVRFSKKTSNQVTIVTVNDLAGMEASQFAYELGEKWGVGGKEHNNGVVVLIKPKTETKGQAFIATGYGVEGVLPDASCSRIVNNEMIPAFKQNDYFAGVVNALNVILPVLAKEYSIEEYEQGGESDPLLGLVVVGGGIFLVFLFIFLMSNGDNKNDKDGNSGTFGGRSAAGDVATAILLGSLLGGRSSGRSGGSFGGGSFGGSFGGFGGGSFGGGGAGGSW